MRRTSSRFALVAVLLLLGTACASSLDTGFPAPSPVEEDGGHGGGGDGGHGGDTTGGDAGGALTGPVEVVDNAYEPKDATVKVGTEVTWEQTGAAPHNVKSADEALFDSHPECSASNIGACMKKGDEFSFTFDKAGEFVYYCVIHGTAQGLGMAGTITVEA